MLWGFAKVGVPFGVLYKKDSNILWGLVYIVVPYLRKVPSVPGMRTGLLNVMLDMIPLPKFPCSYSIYLGPKRFPNNYFRAHVYIYI